MEVPKERSILFDAVSHRNLPVVKLLLEHPKIDATRDNPTPLMETLHVSDQRLTQAFIEVGTAKAEKILAAEQGPLTQPKQAELTRPMWEKLGLNLECSDRDGCVLNPLLRASKCGPEGAVQSALDRTIQMSNANVIVKRVGKTVTRYF